MGLNLIRLNNTGVTPFITKDETEQEAKQKPQRENANKLTAENLDNAYRHGLRIEFQGDYLTTLNYLRRLENLKWGFFWDNFEFKVNDYPDSTVAIEIFTLSLQQEWIGV